MSQTDFNPPKKGSDNGSKFDKMLAGGGAAVLVISLLAVGWVAIEVFREPGQSVGIVGQAEQSRIPWRSVTEGTTEAKKNNKPILYDFTAAWCGPCKMLDINVFSDEHVAKVINEEFVPIRVMDRRQEEGSNPPAIEAAQEHFAISGFPTVIAASPEGTEYSRFEGFRDRVHVSEWLAEVVAAAKSRVKSAAGSD